MMTEIVKKTPMQIAAMHKVMAFQEALRQQPQLPIESQFVQGAGIAAKTIMLPAGATATGGLHKFDNMNIIHSGDITVTTDGDPIRYTVTDFPIVVVAPPCTKRAVWAHADTYWTSLHVSDKTTEKEVREEVIEPDENLHKLIGA